MKTEQASAEPEHTLGCWLRFRRKRGACRLSICPCACHGNPT